MLPLATIRATCVRDKSQEKLRSVTPPNRPLGSAILICKCDHEVYTFMKVLPQNVSESLITIQTGFDYGGRN